MPDPPVVPSLQSTPVKPKLAVLRVARSPPELKELRNELDHDMRGLWVGFVTPEKFINTFLDKAPTDTSPPKLDIPSVKGPWKDHMYGPVLNTVMKTCPNLPIYVNAHAHQKQLQFRLEGGVAAHHLRSTAGIVLRNAGASKTRPKKQKKSLTSKRAKKKASDAEKPVDDQLEHAPFDWQAHGLIFEFKSESEPDPFYSYQEAKALPEPTIAKADEESCQTLGQLAEGAAALLNHQHRTHLFQVFICGDTARFIYWDRAGAVISDKFNLREEKEKDLLPQFLWWYQHMSAPRRGWDETVLEPSTEDVAEFRVHVEQLLADMKDPNSAQRPIAHSEDTLDDSYPPYKIVVNPGKVGKYPQELIVQRPIEVVLSPTGRATRGYIAWSLTEKRLVFLKDSWRIQIDGLDPEGNIYATLIEKKVPGLPTVICAGDVKVGEVVQKTRAQEIARSKELKRRIPSSKSRTHFHHRVVQELAYSLTTAVNSQEYTIAFRDAFRTLEKAYDAGILHRDISFNNIMLDANGKVVVNDWDHACLVVRPAGSPIKMFRTGTWLFMSIALLQDPTKPHELLDDYQSLLWSMLFGALKFIKGDIRLTLSAFTEQELVSRPDGLTIVGGDKKGSLLLNAIYNLNFDSKALAKAFNALGRRWRDYQSPNLFDETERKEQRETMLGRDFWYNLLDPIVMNSDGWQENDLLIEERYPPKSEKVINIEVKKLAFSKIMTTEARVAQSMQCDSGRGTSPDSPLSSLPDEYAAPPSVGTPERHNASLLHHPPGPPASAIDSVGSSGNRSDPPPFLNVNRKRTISFHLEDDDDELPAEPSSSKPKAKRVKKGTEAGAASGSAASGSARPRTRTRSDPPVPARKSSRLQQKVMPAKSALQ